MKSKSLLAIEVVSTALTYKVLNEISENSWLELVEISSGSNAKNLLLFQADDYQKLQTLKQRIEEKYGQPSRRILEIFSPQLYDLCLIQDIKSEILPSLSALVQNPISESLVVFESESICATLSALQMGLSAHALKICDVKLSRQNGGMNSIFLTGTALAAAAASVALQQLLFSNYLVGHTECIASPGLQLRELFGTIA